MHLESMADYSNLQFMRFEYKILNKRVSNGENDHYSKHLHYPK